MEMPGIEPGTFHMRSEGSTTELHPHLIFKMNIYAIVCADPASCANSGVNIQG